MANGKFPNITSNIAITCKMFFCTFLTGFPPQILRIQSPEGTKRVEVGSTDSTSQLFERVHDTFDLNSFAFALYKERNQRNEITSSKTRSVTTAGLRHGDMLYLLPLNGAVLFPNTSVRTFIENQTEKDSFFPIFRAITPLQVNRQ